jgi:peptidyl-dipeptidase Dcp
MKRKSLVVVLIAAWAVLCAFAPQGGNPLLAKFDTPFGVPPFNLIRNEHYMPAFKEAMAQQRQAVERIAAVPAAPTFENTVEALEMSGDLLTRVDNIFNSMNSANTNDTIQQIAKEVAPLRSAHNDAILFNEKLFKRIKAVYDQRAKLALTQEQNRLVEKYYRMFVRNGATLGAGKKTELAEINKELSVLSLQFEENLLKDTNRFELVIEDKADLAGLPDAVVTAAAEAAAQRGKAGKWVFTLHKPSMIPFLQYSQRRPLREKIFTAYITRCDHGDDVDNKKVLTRIAVLRVKRAQLLGYKTHADFQLEEAMAKTPATVYDFLHKLWTPALDRAKRESAVLQATIDKGPPIRAVGDYENKQGGAFKLEPWDWWYYAEKVRKANYDLDDEMLLPYFELENVRAGAFMLANRLYGITFTELTNLPTYQADVRTYEVKEADGTPIGILYTDYFPRANKQGGAWCGAFRSESKMGGTIEKPVITNVGNFTKPAGDTPALLNFDEVTTLFHEFGHALNGLLSDCTYLTTQNVATDFVELPSQIMENWATDPEFLPMYAKHYKTGEPIPADLVAKIKNSSKFNQGFATVEYLAASFLDMDWHTLTEPKEIDPTAFETASLAKIGLIPEIVTRYRSPYFAHIFGDGGYSAGYYSYIWAEVLDADAFQAFKETSLFDQKTAQLFRKWVLAAGASDEEMTLYKKFRGREPRIEPLLERRGLVAGSDSRLQKSN